jgi:hypothetical protein
MRLLGTLGRREFRVGQQRTQHDEAIVLPGGMSATPVDAAGLSHDRRS